MKTKTFIRLIAFAFLLLSPSCLAPNYKKNASTFKLKNIFSESSKAFVYKANFKLYDNEFSGILLIKAKKTSHRIVFINEIGMKFFDLELYPDSFKIHKMFEPMNKKLFVKLLVGDFNFMLMTGLKKDKRYYSDKEEKHYAVKIPRQKSMYIFDKKSLLPVSGFKYSALRKNVFLSYSDFKGKIPGKISIKHKNIKFEADFKYLK